jgi:hypothetical protein
MRVLVSGSGGLIGRAVCNRLELDQHIVVGLSRSVAKRESESIWEPIRSGTWEETIGSIDAVVHLAGEPIAGCRWSRTQKQRIYDSRVIGTRQLSEQLAALNTPPKVMIAASATGYYGDRGDELLTEASAPGSGFLSQVCRDWEAATRPAVEAGIRVVNLRIGMVLSDQGGALDRLRPLFRLGLGGRLGSGRQFMSWISIEDLTSVFAETLTDQTITGPVNAVSPGSVTNREFTRSMAHWLRRPAWFAVPAAVLRLVIGEMADEMLLTSARVLPQKLGDKGFSFKYPNLDAALGDL